MSAASEFVLLSQWRINAPREQVWPVLRTPAEWPQWWPYVAAVEELDGGDAHGCGARHRVRWTSRLPYALTLDTRVIEITPQQLIRIRAEGDLHGEGCWRLQAEGQSTTVEYLWRVALEKPWMRLLEPALRPLFAWNHNAVMAAGEKGLQDRLRLGGGRGAAA